MHRMLLVPTLLLGLSLPAQATFIPPGELSYENIVSVGPANMDEAEFNAILGGIDKAYAPVVAMHGGKLKINGGWKNEKLNAAATQSGGSWIVEITGGLARRPELSKDGFALIACHELGHHLGGFPYDARGGFGGVWAAAEGQSDYFSTQICARKLWKEDLELNATYRTSAPEFVRAACDVVWSTSDEQNLCYRISMGVESMTRTMAILMKKPIPQFETPDPAVVTKTNTSHPAVQCRLDTAWAGSLCAVTGEESLIPGKRSAGSKDGIDAEREAAMNSCLEAFYHQHGRRPLCWFKPRL